MNEPTRLLYSTESILTKAKLNYEARYSSMPVSERHFHIVLEPEDFDPDFNRGSSEGSNCRELLQDLVDDSTIRKLESYQKLSSAAQKYNLNPRDLVPTNFVFKGPPGVYTISSLAQKLLIIWLGTGKTTTALKMGNIFYNLGFLSTDTVVSSTATDLVGQYVGQTAPKTKTQLDKALGKVLVIDEIHQLKGGHYATEAVHQIIQFLSRAEIFGRIVVILIGHTQDTNELMAAYPALSGLFSEEIVFENVKAEDCVTLLERHLAKTHIRANFLKETNSDGYKQVLSSFNSFSALPSWSNARDIQALARRITATHIHNILHYHEQDDLEEFPPLPSETALSCLSHVLQTQMDRSNRTQSPNKDDVPSISPTDPFTNPFQYSSDFRRAPPPPAMHTDKSVERTGISKLCIPIARLDSLTEQSPIAPFKEAQQQKIVELDEGEESDGERLSINISESDHDDEGYDSSLSRVSREPDVSEETWNALLSSKKAWESQDAADTTRLSAIKHESFIFRQKMLRPGGLSKDDKRNWDEIEDERKRLEDAKRKKKDIQKALRMHGPCPYGYDWSRVGNMWFCAGGMHAVTDSKLSGWL